MKELEFVEVVVVQIAVVAVVIVRVVLVIPRGRPSVRRCGEILFIYKNDVSTFGLNHTKLIKPTSSLPSLP